MSFINVNIMETLEVNGTLEEKDKLDSVCIAFDAGQLCIGNTIRNRKVQSTTLPQHIPWT